MVDAGLAAVEAFHSEHDAPTTEHYLMFAERTASSCPAARTITARKSAERRRSARSVLPQDQFELEARVRRVAQDGR